MAQMHIRRAQSSDQSPRENYMNGMRANFVIIDDIEPTIKELPDSKTIQKQYTSSEEYKNFPYRYVAYVDWIKDILTKNYKFHQIKEIGSPYFVFGLCSMGYQSGSPKYICPFDTRTGTVFTVNQILYKENMIDCYYVCKLRLIQQSSLASDEAFENLELCSTLKKYSIQKQIVNHIKDFISKV